MKVKVGDAIVYRDPLGSSRYGTGLVASIVPDEYAILWSRRGLTRYKRSILDDRLDEIFQLAENTAGPARERLLNIGASNRGVAFNDNYDREEVAALCEKLKTCQARHAKEVGIGLASELLTKKNTLRGAARGLLLKLAELCGTRSSAREVARSISSELFFGYVLNE